MIIVYDTAIVGDLYSRQIYSPNSELTLAEGLPSSLIISNTGLISGYLEQAGRFAISIFSRGTGGTGVSVFDLTVNNPSVPVITSQSTLNQQTERAFEYQITTDSLTPILSYGATNLPDGVSIDTNTGLISGIATSDSDDAIAVVTAILTATNDAGTGHQNLIFNLKQRPVITSSLADLVFQSGVEITPYTITASKSPVLFGVEPGLPPGLSLNTLTGEISGTPVGNSLSVYKISANNGIATATANIVISVTAVPNIQSENLTSKERFLISYQILASGNPPVTSYNATNLPSGLSVNTSTGLITGYPDNTGSSSVTLSATNSIGTTTKPVTFNIVETNFALVDDLKQVYPISSTQLLAADKNNNAIRIINLEESYFGRATSIATFATGITQPYGVVKTPNGTVYASSPSTGKVYKRAGSSWTEVATGLTNPRGMRPDLDNNVYVAAGSVIKKITNSGTVTTLASGMTNLNDLDLVYKDGSIDHFMSVGGNAGSGTAWRITPAGTVIELTTGFPTLYGIFLLAAIGAYPFYFSWDLFYFDLLPPGFLLSSFNGEAPLSSSIHSTIPGDGNVPSYTNLSSTIGQGASYVTSGGNRGIICLVGKGFRDGPIS
jgi:Putative Ig domain